MTRKIFKYSIFKFYKAKKTQKESQTQGKGYLYLLSQDTHCVVTCFPISPVCYYQKSAGLQHQHQVNEQVTK